MKSSKKLHGEFRLTDPQGEQFVCCMLDYLLILFRSNCRVHNFYISSFNFVIIELIHE